jgi:hypothetical protein
MDELTKKSKIERFLHDRTMSEAVYGVLLESFLKRKGGEDTEMKAARFIATELLEEGWATLERYKSDTESREMGIKQIAL